MPSALRLATEFAGQFQHIPPEEAAHTVARHIHTCWHPRMWSQLKDQVAHAGENCDDIVSAAARLIYEEPPEFLGERRH